MNRLKLHSAPPQFSLLYLHTIVDAAYKNLLQPTAGAKLVVWRYAKDSVKKKILARELTDSLIHMTLTNPDSIVRGRRGRLIAQKEHLKTGFGNLLIRVVYEEKGEERIVVSAYWARPERYRRGEKE